MVTLHSKTSRAYCPPSWHDPSGTSPEASFVANPWSMPRPFVVSLDPRYAEELCGLSVLAS